MFFDVEGPEDVREGAILNRLTTPMVSIGSSGNSDHSVFKPAFAALRDVARIIYDLAGAGRSDAEPDGVFSLERQAHDRVEFCTLLEIEKPVVPGVSAGGFVATASGILTMRGERSLPAPRQSRRSNAHCGHSSESLAMKRRR